MSPRRMVEVDLDGDLLATVTGQADQAIASGEIEDLDAFIGLALRRWVERDDGTA